jgi:hypothetical protein
MLIIRAEKRSRRCGVRVVFKMINRFCKIFSYHILSGLFKGISLKKSLIR